MDDIPLNGTTCTNEVKPKFGKNIEDGDHQLAGRAFQLNAGGLFHMEHFECVCPCSTASQIHCAYNLAAFRIENLSGNGFDFLSAGPTAQNVPAQAVIVDNTDPAIIYHNKSLWFDYSDGLRDYRRSVSYTSTNGASLSYSFDGVAIWYDFVSHAIQRLTHRIGFTVVYAIFARHSRYRLMVRHRCGRLPHMVRI